MCCLCRREQATFWGVPLANKGLEPPSQSSSLVHEEPSAPGCLACRTLTNLVLQCGELGSGRSRPKGSPASFAKKREATFLLPSLLPITTASCLPHAEGANGLLPEGL